MILIQFPQVELDGAPAAAPCEGWCPNELQKAWGGYLAVARWVPACTSCSCVCLSSPPQHGAKCDFPYPQWCHWSQVQDPAKAPHLARIRHPQFHLHQHHGQGKSSLTSAYCRLYSPLEAGLESS